ncbi:hypothetical protein BIT28_09600 [Photobacterium proteolyticum]|uniref:Uncharacterized protein n=1 Tax=Photobacterium proteolyticum TaxID=1903952 RepID=A0A1Q9H1R1_9GAMM|nr:hypothetical protein [Photobacterium proteolyticum]OLQ81617.1 hypothetical protein BIT28_09600 [Photobacterium proteolyticum]
MLLRASDTEQQLVVKHCLCLHQVIHPTQTAAALAELRLTKAELPDSEGSESGNAGLNSSYWWTEDLSSPQQAWLNQGLLEYFGLMPLFSELAQLQYWALLPWQVLEEVLTLWSAWFHLDAIIRIICRHDLQVIRDNLGNDYDWLMAHGRLHPANPHPIELSSHSHSSLSWLSNLARRSRSKSARDPYSITALNWQQEKAQTRNLIVGKLTQDWSESWRWLLQLKLPVCSENASTPSSALSSLSINTATSKALSPSLLVCLQRKSPEWYEWLKRFQP